MEKEKNLKDKKATGNPKTHASQESLALMLHKSYSKDNVKYKKKTSILGMHQMVEETDWQIQT